MKKVILIAAILGLYGMAIAADVESAREKQADLRFAAASALAASSQWTTLQNVEPATTYFRGVMARPGAVWMYGATTPASSQYIFRSTDGGSNFTKTVINVVTSTSSSGPRFVMDALDTNRAVIGTFRGEILRTTNGGAKWDTVYSYGPVPSGFFDGIRYVSKDTIIGFGDQIDSTVQLVRSVDGGATFTRVTNFPKNKGAFGYASHAQVMDSYGQNVWIALYADQSANPGANPVILRSTNGGNTWDTTTVKMQGGQTQIASICFKDASVGYMVDPITNFLYKTTDGGLTWANNLRVVPYGQDSTKVFVTAVRPIRGTSNVVATGIGLTGSQTWWSSDDGATWTALVTPGAGLLRGASFTSSTVGFAVGNKIAMTYTPSVAVTFMANTSGVPDTMKTTSTVQVRGGTSQLTWDNNSVRMTNAGGEYWKTTVRFAPGTAVPYKFFTNVKSAITGSDNGWEANVATTSTNRELTVGNNDTTLAVQYVNAFSSGAAQSAAPFLAKPDSYYVCYIRVNMQSYADFNPALHVVGVRGSFAASGWGTTILGTPQGQHANAGQGNYNGDNFYKLAVYWRKTLVDTATSAEAKTMRWKWVIHSVGHSLTEDWSLMVKNPDFQQEFVMPKKDTTINWVWFNNTPYIPPAGTDTTTFVFVTNLAKAINSNSIKPGDSVSVRFGYNGSAAAITTHLLVKKGLLGQLYVDTAKVIGVKVDPTKQGFYYQYYLTKNATEYREVYYDFFYTGADPGLAEKRKDTIRAKNATFVIYDTLSGAAAAHRQPYWQSTVKLTKNVLVTFTCDLRPAFFHFLNGDSLFDVQSAFRNMGPGDKDSVYNWGVWMNGPAVGGWSNPTGNDWGVGLRTNSLKKMFDNGTHGDAVSGDHIYSLQQTFYKDSLNNTVGQVFKFGLYAGDNEGGKGGYGNNHVENINDGAATYTLASDFGSINPKWFRAWNYDLHKPTSVSRVDGVPLSYALDQNYPNPFNPSTTINYSIPVSGRVTMRIFNVLGQEVGTLLNSDQSAGKYQLTFDASRYSSGVYFYRIEAGTFSAVKKMMLLK